MQSDRHERHGAAVGKGPPDNAHTSRFLYVRRHLTPRTWKGLRLGQITVAIEKLGFQVVPARRGLRRESS
jgi:hypothetical protein